MTAIRVFWGRQDEDSASLPTFFSRPFFSNCNSTSRPADGGPLHANPQLGSPLAAGLRLQSTLPYNMTLCRFNRGVTITQPSGCRRICLTTSPISHPGLGPPRQGLILLVGFVSGTVVIPQPRPHLLCCYRECDDLHTRTMDVYTQRRKAG